MSTQVLTGQGSVALRSWVALLRAHAVTVKDLSGKLYADHGLTINDYEALLCISQAEGERMRRVDLADELILTASGVTRLLDGLERSGFVAREACATDRRVVYAKLTPAGNEKLQASRKTHLAGVYRLFVERFSSEELASLAELLERLPGANGDSPDC